MAPINPAYKYADDNDFTEQAQWTVEAYQMMKNWGWVGPAFLWNLNFRVVANGTELAQWGIVDPVVESAAGLHGPGTDGEVKRDGYTGASNDATDERLQ